MYKHVWLFALGFCLFFVTDIVPATTEQISEDQRAAVVHPVRALHIVLRHTEVADVLWLSEMAKSSGFNTLILALGDAVNMEAFPGRSLPDAWSRNDLWAVWHRARELGLMVIPEIKLLSHQEKLFNEARPELMYNRATYDPRKPEVYEDVLPYLDEIIDLLQPIAIHIGHDEVAGYNRGSKKKWLRSDEQMLPSDLFLKDVVRIHAHLKKRGVETWMWGDMLISPDEFPNMLAKHLHGTVPGYGKALRNKLPKDIVICDWHYFDEQTEFPSLATFKAEGFRVLGATWKKPETIRNFSRYAKRHGADGMIATTWFHVQRMEWGIVEQIIRESGEAFLRAQ